MITAAGTTTINHDGFELFEAMSSANVGATSAIKPTGVTAETLSNIWIIDYPTEACTLESTT